MKVAVIDRQRRARIDHERLRDLARYFMQLVVHGDSPATWEAITVILADDAVIRRINADFLSHDCPTDVIAFSYAPMPGAEPGATGELVINVERAQLIGYRYGGPDRELALYLAHGCDHLGGADDATPVGRRRMRARECRWLRSRIVRDRMDGLIRRRTA